MRDGHAQADWTQSGPYAVGPVCNDTRTHRFRSATALRPLIRMCPIRDWGSPQAITISIRMIRIRSSECAKHEDKQNPLGALPRGLLVFNLYKLS